MTFFVRIRDFFLRSLGTILCNPTKKNRVIHKDIHIYARVICSGTRARSKKFSNFLEATRKHERISHGVYLQGDVSLYLLDTDRAFLRYVHLDLHRLRLQLSQPDLNKQPKAVVFAHDAGQQQAVVVEATAAAAAAVTTVIIITER